jgi:uncharacterized membrane protein
MFMTIVALICHAAVSNGVDVCVEKVVVDSSTNDQLTMQSCMMGEPAVVDWLNRTYPGYRIERWRCIPGHYVPSRSI